MEESKLKVKVLEEREKAYLLLNEEGKEDWFPKSQVSFERRNVKTQEGTAIIPDWLLENKGW